MSSIDTFYGQHIDPAMAAVYEDMVKNKTYSFLMFTLNEATQEISITKTAPRRCNHDVLVAALPPNDICWGVVLVEYKLCDNAGYREKLVFFSWVPDTLRRDSLKDACRIKMIGSGSIGYIQKTLKASTKTADIPFLLQCCDLEEASWSYFLTKASKFEMAPVDKDWLPWQHPDEFRRTVD